MLKNESDLKPGVSVRYTDPETGGFFDGQVIGFVTAAEVTGKPESGSRITQVRLRPWSVDVQKFLGPDGAIVLGKGHWESCLTLL